MRVLIVLIFFAVTSVGAEQGIWSGPSLKKINNLITSSHIPERELGIWIGYEKGVNPNSLFEHNSDKLFEPASLSKTVTGLVTFKKIPLDHKFKTQIYYQGELKNGVLKGDIILKGGGDASFVSESMWSLVNKFSRSGIKKIEGDLIVDDSFFDNERFSQNRESVRVDRAYDAPVGAMSFNWNSVNVFVRPGDKIGSPVKVFADPQSEYIRVVNRAVTVKGLGKQINVSRGIDPKRQGDTIIVSGSLGILRDEVVSYKGILQPDIWSGLHLKEFLLQRGIVISGKVKNGKVKEDSLLVAEQESVDLRKMVADMMKYSNNYVAEMLTKNLSAYVNKSPGGIADGIGIIRDFLQSEIGFDPKYFNFVNPSGLTRNNRFRPKDLAKLLNYAKDDFTLYPEFLASLPVAGTDGTLRDRMNGTHAKGWVRAKTGTLNGVLGLAGYAGRKNGNELTFVFIFNGEQKRINNAVRLFDNLAVHLVK